jgi:cation diffusion facilitator CzcD-associated flavoprotein CzcO
LDKNFKEADPLKDKLKPNYPIGCKRIAPHNEYYEALNLPNVKVFTCGIKQVKGNSIETLDGKETKLDVNYVY